MVAISAVVIVACFVFLAAFVMVTLIESYFVIHAGVFFMAFGGSEWTRDYAMAIFRYAVSVGAKLLVLQLIVQIIMTSARSWQAQYTHDETSMFTMLGVAMMCAYFSRTLGDRVQDLINGVSLNGGSALGGMAAAGLAGAAAGAAAMSATMGRMSLGGTGSGVADFIKSGMSGSSVGGGPASPSNFTNSGGSASGASKQRPITTNQRGRLCPASWYPPKQHPRFRAIRFKRPVIRYKRRRNSVIWRKFSVPNECRSKDNAGAHMATEAAVRTVGVLGSMSVPGMDSASGVSIGPPPTPPDLSGETPENIIRPASPEIGFPDEPGEPPPEEKRSYGYRDQSTPKGKPGNEFD